MTQKVPATGMPLRVGQVVALGLDRERCPVGFVDAVDDEFVTLLLSDWVTGRFSAGEQAVRLNDIQEIHWAHGELDEQLDMINYDMEPLAKFQDNWQGYGK